VVEPTKPPNRIEIPTFVLFQSRFAIGTPMPANVMRPAKFCGFDIYTCVCVYIKEENQNRPLQRNPQKYQVSLDEAGKQTATAQSQQPEQDPPQ